MNLTMERDTNLDCNCKLDDTFTSASSSSKEREKEIPLHSIWKTRLETAPRLLANYAAFMTEETICHELISNVLIPVACTFRDGAVAVLTCQCFEELVCHKNMVSAMLDSVFTRILITMRNQGQAMVKIVRLPIQSRVPYFLCCKR